MSNNNVGPNLQDPIQNKMVDALCKWEIELVIIVKVESPLVYWRVTIQYTHLVQEKGAKCVQSHA